MYWNFNSPVHVTCWIMNAPGSEIDLKICLIFIWSDPLQGASQISSPLTKVCLLDTDRHDLWVDMAVSWIKFCGQLKKIYEISQKWRLFHDVVAHIHWYCYIICSRYALLWSFWGCLYHNFLIVKIKKCISQFVCKAF